MSCLYFDVFNSFFCLFYTIVLLFPPSSFPVKKEKNIHLKIVPPYTSQLSFFEYVWRYLFGYGNNVEEYYYRIQGTTEFSSSISSVCASVWVCICLSLKRSESIDIDIMKFMLIFAEEWNTENEIKKNCRSNSAKKKKQ